MTPQYFKITTNSVIGSSFFFLNIKSDAFWLSHGTTPGSLFPNSADDQTKEPVFLSVGTYVFMWKNLWLNEYSVLDG